MASLLDILGLGATAAARQGTARMEGDQIRKATEERDLLAQLAQRRQAAMDARQASMDDLTRRNIESQMAERNAPPPPPAPRRQIVDGQIVDLDAGSARPIEGYTAPVKQAPTPAAGSFTQFVGPDGRPVFFNPQTGAQVAAPEGFKPASAATGNPTEGERKAAGLLMSGESGYNNLRTLLDGSDNPDTPEVETGTPMRTPTLWDRAKSSVGFGVGNVLSSEQMQQMEQAAYDLQEAWMRLTSGGAIQPEEIRQASKALIPQPGDSEAVLAQKARARKVRIDALRMAAGRAAASPNGSVNPNAGGADEYEALIVRPGRTP